MKRDLFLELKEGFYALSNERDGKEKLKRHIPREKSNSKKNRR